jgi:Plasmid encoded RepA protein
VQFALTVPFGQDRLIPIWVTTLALQQKSRAVRFEKAAQMLDFFKLPHDGPHYRRIMKGFQRLFAATIFFGTENDPDRKLVIDQSRFHFFDRLRLWLDADTHRTVIPTDTAQGEGNIVTLSEAFYSEIDQHRIPVERGVVAALAHAPGMLDFYLWIVWKSWTVNGRPAYVPITSKGGLSQQLGAKEYSLDRRFRHKIGSWLRKVKIFWPECPVTISRDRQVLVIHSSRQLPALRMRNPL